MGQVTAAVVPSWPLRRLASTAMVVLSSIALFVAIVAGWAGRSVFDSDEFANRAVASLDSSAVRGALAEQIADTLSAQAATSLSSFRPELIAVIEELNSTS
jgi:hypothetical protein